MNLIASWDGEEESDFRNPFQIDTEGTEMKQSLIFMKTRGAR